MDSNDKTRVQRIPETRRCSSGICGLPSGGKSPNSVPYCVTVDIDRVDPPVAPGVGTPSHGGFLYYEVLEILQGLVGKGEVVGIDLVDVAPDYDQTGSTAFLAVQLLVNFLGFIFHAKGRSG